jgi:serine/threonine protein kinase
LGRFTPEVCCFYTKQLISAIKYLHYVGVTHRDLKLENILFDTNFQLKVADFGLARDAEGKDKDFRLTSKCGTEGFMPPEM